jgi:hypothetical protein
MVVRGHLGPLRPCPRSVGRAEGSRHRNASTAEDLVRTARSRQSETYSVQASKASVCLPASLGHLGHHDSSSAPGPGRVDDGIEDWAALGEGRHECPGPPAMVCGLRQRWPAARTGPWNRASHLVWAGGGPGRPPPRRWQTGGHAAWRCWPRGARRYWRWTPAGGIHFWGLRHFGK